MPYKDDYLRTIINSLSSASGDSFQSKCSTVLQFYYRQKGLAFEKVGPARGDYKNDGWVETESIYYQMFSPEQFSDSFVHELYEKFVRDFSGLCKHVFQDGKWSGKISKYFFLVNTRDRDVPRDENRIVLNTKQNMESTYGVTIDDVRVVNKDYIINVLNELTIDQLDDLATILGLSGAFDVISKTPRDYRDFLARLSSEIVRKNFFGSPSDYEKIPNIDKIRINDLGEYEERIVKICSHLSVVEEAVDSYLQDEPDGKKLQSVINLYVKTYLDLKPNYHGPALYEQMLESISALISRPYFKETAEVFLVYIFDRCDIFERT